MDKDASGDRSRESLGSRFARDKPSSSERLVRKEGFEPPRPFGHKILSLARLPVPPLPQWWVYSTSLKRAAPLRFLAFMRLSTETGIRRSLSPKNSRFYKHERPRYGTNPLSTR